MIASSLWTIDDFISDIRRHSNDMVLVDKIGEKIFKIGEATYKHVPWLNSEIVIKLVETNDRKTPRSIDIYKFINNIRRHSNDMALVDRTTNKSFKINKVTHEKPLKPLNLLLNHKIVIELECVL